ncbi:MbcA/ParS/Xre antitoxin family protein [Shumkonia mesophila]|uniref:MbcA/ParS/Xre antitoxin family protein n=1 Tax=Shumkonia mesophila TaxID=2838854 RepID=UPI002934C64A|nr:MbcA/ParS/Xre antitoxin family protein [Shumkonia mesophila]
MNRDDVIAKAMVVLGSQEAAQSWLNRPAIGLAGARPADLLGSQDGIALVAEYLDRIDAGVYC